MGKKDSGLMPKEVALSKATALCSGSEHCTSQIMEKLSLWNVSVQDAYDIMDYLVNEYKESRNKPKTKQEFFEFVNNASKYQFFGRCEYEIILKDWPCQSHEEKWDIYDQIMMNIELITDILMKNVL